MKKLLNAAAIFILATGPRCAIPSPPPDVILAPIGGKLPAAAIFNGPPRYALLLGCEALRNLWKAKKDTPISTLDYSNILQTADLIFDLHCKPDSIGKVQNFQSVGEPGSIVVTGRGQANPHRFYVDSTEWWDRFGEHPKPVSQSKLLSFAPNRGPDLSIYRPQNWCMWKYARNGAAYHAYSKLEVATRSEAIEMEKALNGTVKPGDYFDLYQAFFCSCDKIKGKKEDGAYVYRCE